MLSASLCSSSASTTATATWGRCQQGGERAPSPVITRVSTYRGETTPVTLLFSAIYRGTTTPFTTIVRGPSFTWQFYIFSSPCKNGGILNGSAAGSSGSFSIKYQQICHMTARRPPCSSCIKSFPSWANSSQIQVRLLIGKYGGPYARPTVGNLPTFFKLQTWGWLHFLKRIMVKWNIVVFKKGSLRSGRFTQSSLNSNDGEGWPPKKISMSPEKGPSQKARLVLRSHHFPWRGLSFLRGSTHMKNSQTKNHYMKYFPTRPQVGPRIQL